eukprot:3480335-Prymnesium_polylepis.2
MGVRKDSRGLGSLFGSRVEPSHLTQARERWSGRLGFEQGSDMQQLTVDCRSSKHCQQRPMTKPHAGD